MSEPVLRIFSYLPNPRVWKALIAARLARVEVEVVGDEPAALGAWLWDFDARKLDDAERTATHPAARTARRGFSGTLYKTAAFLKAHPFGTVPAAFSPDGSVGVFESNSILRAVARAAPEAGLYGRDGYEASRIDSFLDAGLVFAREAQVYLLALRDLDPATHARMAAAYEFYLSGIESALGQGAYLVGDVLSIADISFVCDLGQFLQERRAERRLGERELEPISRNGAREFPRAFAHLFELSEREAFAEFMGGYLKGIAA